MNRGACTERAEPSWRPLYQAGAVAALFAVILFRPHLSAELSLLHSLGLMRWGASPGSPREWLALLRDQPGLGLLLLDVGDLVHYALLGLVFLALFAALREVRRSALLIAASACFVGITVYFATNPAFALLSLSRQYSTAVETQRASLVAAAQAVLAASNPAGVYQGTGIYMSRFLIHLAGLLASGAMLRAGVFSNAAAIAGLLANGLYLLYFPVLVLTPAWLALPPSLAAPLRMAWHLLVAVRLLRLARSAEARG
jgi:hypothetical protein